MNRLQAAIIDRLTRVSTRYMPFADAVSADLPLGRLLRLSLFQVSVGMASVLLVGTLNRVMILELGVPAWLVAAMVALPFLFAPFRALVGFRSDTHKSAFGWRRVPYIWTGTMLQFGGLAIMPFALLVLSGDGEGPAIYGHIGAALAFLLVGAGLHTTQTAGLALATDLATPATRARVVALMYVVLLLGMIGSGFAFSVLLADFSALKLIQVVQGAAVVTFALNVIALWKQEARRSAPPREPDAPTHFIEAWARFAGNGAVRRFLVAVGLGTAAFNMQDIILEPYGGEVLRLSVGETTMLTALLAGGALIAFALAARALAHEVDPYRLAALGVLAGLVGFPLVIFAGPFDSAMMFRIGVSLIGFGGGLFAVSTLTAAMGLETGANVGLAIGAWGAVQATMAGGSIAAGGLLRDLMASVAASGSLGPAFLQPAVPYSFVYHLEVLLLFVTLVALGPLVRSAPAHSSPRPVRIGLAELPN
jgi:BCD family chlorophyll transporter-like MFS transporter